MSFMETVGRLQTGDPAPLYMQLQKVLRDAIVSRVISPEAAIPPERDLAEEFGVSRLTVRKAVDGLVAEGLIKRRRGAGTFVAARVEKSFSKLSSFSEDMRSRGRVPHSEWLARSGGAVTPEESLSLGLSPGSLVYRFQRLRYADSQTMALEYSTIPAYCLPSLEAVSESLYAALDAAGNRPVRALQRLRAVAFTTEQADILGIRAGDAGLFIERRGFLQDGRAAEFTQSFYRGDAYDVVAELNRAD
ncbi:GntR family transcriptional regulator [Asticcacaulis sp. AC402]|uniref:GntR family transcriptional regulator n=1 Tax=Asticcacaulis sp. AC402 TaxID=1282361 RepID=UPI0003C3CDC5|nr:GntR family transcriptional regulator [Asticcacaulis sp. AC402]ESQ75912.1 GntR family transcriptional regulator [Asticcacaulis sp. AC402]